MITPHYYQVDAVDALFNFYNEPRRVINGHLERKNPLVCMPTGTGKSVVIARFIQRWLFERDPEARFFMSTHIRKLIRQNAEKVLKMWPTAPLGIYSAGLKERQFIQPIIFGGIQSAVGKKVFGHRDFLIIDEAHLVGDDGEYIKFIEELLADNPYLKVIGLSATPYRMGLGSLTNGKIFTHIVYDICDMAGFARLMSEGYLCPLVAKPTNVEVDLRGVSISKGEYVQGQLETAVEKVTREALDELVKYSAGRKSWLVFAAGVQNADHVGSILNEVYGVSTAVIHSKKKDDENDKAIEDWIAGKYTAAVSMGMLTTGVDNPACDYIGMLRATCSPGLWVQMLGRGTRPFYADGFDIADTSQRLKAIELGGKSNCMVMDFARNTRRLGPIDDPLIPKKKGDGPPGDAPVKICDSCGCYAHASARVCIVCGAVFEIKTKLHKAAGHDPLLRSDAPEYATFPVEKVVLAKHTSRAGIEQIKVCYYCHPLRTFYEYQNFESKVPFVVHKAHNWFRQRFPYDQFPHQPRDAVPPTNDLVLGLMSELRPPARIRVHVNKQPGPEVVGYEF